MSDELATQVLAELAALRAEVKTLREGEGRLGVEVAARIIGCSRRQVWNLVERGILARGRTRGKGSARLWTLEEIESAKKLWKR